MFIGGANIITESPDKKLYFSLIVNRISTEQMIGFFKIKSRILLIGFLLLIISSCKKEENIPPVVEIFSPYSGQQYFQGDTIFYHFKVSDDEGVTNVKAAIANSFYQTIISRNYLNAGKVKEYEGYFLTEGLATLGTTNHFIVSATDGNDETKAGKEIIIHQSPKFTKAIYAATVLSNSFNIVKIDTMYNQQNVISGTGDFLKMHISSKDQVLYKSGKFSGNLAAYDLNSHSEKWNEDANSVAGNPAFHNISLSDDIIFVSYDNETIKGYDKNKLIKFSAFAGTSNYAVNTIKNKTIVLTEEYSYPYIQTNLKSYYYGTGVGAKTKSAGQLKIIDLFNKGENEYVIIGNENSVGKIQYYNFLNNSISPGYLIPVSYTIIDAEYIQNENVILVQLISGLYKFNLSNNNLLPILPGTNFQIIKFDEVKSEVIAVNVNTITFYSYPQMQLINTVSTSAPIKAIEILYNR